MLRILLIWIVGILINFYFHVSLLEVTYLFIGLMVISLLIPSPLNISIVLLLGVMYLSVVYNKSYFVFRHTHPPAISSFVIKVVQAPKEKPKTWEVLGIMTQFKVNHTWQKPKLPWKVTCYFSKKFIKPHAGQIWAISDSVRPFDAPTFPYEKDWRVYHLGKGVIGSVFVHQKNAKVLRPFAVVSFQQYFQKIQSYLLKSFQYLPSPKNREVAEAMILGETQGIDGELQMAYSALGAVHILSVSGMHLGILFIVLQTIFGFFQKYIPQTKFLFFLLLLLIIWAYAGLTGFSAPVLRASWVFSFILFAKYFKQPIQSLNLLASSCWFLLLIHPSDLFNPGFQLSYLAVLGLIWFQPKLLSIIHVHKKKWTQKIGYFLWESTTVAISAQVLTLPLVIFYFYQMPNPVYFFLLNPFLLLISTIALVASFILVGLYPLVNTFNDPIFLEKAGYLVNLIYEIMHQVMLYFSRSNPVSISFLYLDWKELLLVYFSIFMMVLWLKIRNVYLLWIFNFTVLYFSVQRLYLQPIQTTRQHFSKIVEFRKEIIGIKIKRDQLLLVGPAKYVRDPKWFSQHITPLAARYHVSDTVSRVSQ